MFREADREGFSMTGTAKLDWTSKLNIVAVCASLALIGAVVFGVF